MRLRVTLDGGGRQLRGKENRAPWKENHEGLFPSGTGAPEPETNSSTPRAAFSGGGRSSKGLQQGPAVGPL